jgi:hypothetical protein
MTAHIPDVARAGWSSIPLYRTHVRWYYNFVSGDQNNHNDSDAAEGLQADAHRISVAAAGEIWCSSGLSSPAESGDQPNSPRREVIHGRR